MFYENIEENLNEIKAKALDTYNNILDTYSFQKMEGELLDDYASLFGISRLSAVASNVFAQYIKISFEEKVEEYVIPANTKFYISGDIYCQTTVDELFTGTDIFIDVVFPQTLDENITIPVTSVLRIESSNQNVIGSNATTMYEVSNTSNSESDAEFRQRICECIAGKNLNTYDKVHYIFKTLGLTDYAIDKTNKLLAGTCVVYLNPPVYEKFNDYAEKVSELAKSVYYVNGLSIIVKKPLIRELHILNYDNINSNLVKYISELGMGVAPDVSLLKEYAGKNIIIKVDGDIVATPVLKYNEKFQLLVDENIE